MNLWILTEERPKIEVLKQILNKFGVDKGFAAFLDNLRILPVLKTANFLYYYPYVKMMMLYNLQIEQKKQSTDTNIFGTRLLLTLGVEILGKN
jgi:hypothetical protein